MGSSVKITPVPNHLGRKLRKPGGISKDMAVAEASKNVESLRDEFVAAIPGEIQALEEILSGDIRGVAGAITLDAMLRRAGQILTLSGTYGFDRLDVVVKRFCDLVMGMQEKNIEDIAPIKVHLRAMRLVYPGAPEISDEEVAHVLEGLARVHSHYGILPRAQDPAPEEG